MPLGNMALKTLRKKEKMLVASIFSFSHEVCTLLKTDFFFLLFNLLSANALKLVSSKTLSYGNCLNIYFTWIEKQVYTTCTLICLDSASGALNQYSRRLLAIGHPLLEVKLGAFLCMFIDTTTKDISINSLPNDKILDQSNLKDFADDTTNVTHEN